MTRERRRRVAWQRRYERAALRLSCALAVMPLSIGALSGCKSKEPTRTTRPQATVDDTAIAETRPVSGIVSGSADGWPFANAAAFLIESPDVESTTVVYLFSKPPRCVDLSFSGWDQRLAEGTTFLELKIFGRDPKPLSIVTSETPGQGQAVANYVRTLDPNTVKEIRASGGSVTLAVYVPRSYASVTFSLAFGTNRLMGNVTAVFCPGGHEP